MASRERQRPESARLPLAVVSQWTARDRGPSSRARAAPVRGSASAAQCRCSRRLPGRRPGSASGRRPAPRRCPRQCGRRCRHSRRDRAGRESARSGSPRRSRTRAARGTVSQVRAAQPNQAASSGRGFSVRRSQDRQRTRLAVRSASSGVSAVRQALAESDDGKALPVAATVHDPAAVQANNRSLRLLSMPLRRSHRSRDPRLSSSVRFAFAIRSSQRQGKRRYRPCPDARRFAKALSPFVEWMEITSTANRRGAAWLTCVPSRNSSPSSRPSSLPRSDRPRRRPFSGRGCCGFFAELSKWPTQWSLCPSACRGGSAKR